MSEGRYRAVLEEAFRAGVEAVREPARLISHLPAEPPTGRTLVLGAGKASAELARQLEGHLHGELDGLVITREGFGPAVPPTRIPIVEASHPVPDERGFAATLRMMEMCERAGARDRVIFLASGGGSSLLSCPAPGLSRAEKREVHQALVRSGVPIDEINLVRSHLSAVKGGRLAARIPPAELFTFVVSDVVGDRPESVASGPTLALSHQPLRARDILKRAHIPISAAMDRVLTESQPVKAVAHPVEVVATASDALDAVEQHLQQAGWRTQRIGDDIEGDATDVGRSHGERALRVKRESGRVALISGGELTVRVHNPKGRGGPNLDYLAALMLMLDGAEGIEALACDSDGVDGTEDNAGGYLCPAMGRSSAETARQRLERNLSYDLFKDLDGLVVTGPTLTNVNDIRIILVDDT